MTLLLILTSFLLQTGNKTSKSVNLQGVLIWQAIRQDIHEGTAKWRPKYDARRYA